MVYLSPDKLLHAERQIPVEAGTDEADQALHASLLLCNHCPPILCHVTALALAQHGDLDSTMTLDDATPCYDVR